MGASARCPSVTEQPLASWPAGSELFPSGRRFTQNLVFRFPQRRIWTARRSESGVHHAQAKETEIAHGASGRANVEGVARGHQDDAQTVEFSPSRQELLFYSKHGIGIRPHSVNKRSSHQQSVGCREGLFFRTCSPQGCNMLMTDRPSHQ